MSVESVQGAAGRAAGVVGARVVTKGAAVANPGDGVACTVGSTDKLKGKEDGMMSDAADSDAGSDVQTPQDADCYTDSDDSDASTEEAFNLDGKDLGIARDGKVWTLPSVIKALRNKEDMVLRLEALQAVYHLAAAAPPEL